MGDILLGVIAFSIYIVFIGFTLWLLIVSIKDRDPVLFILTMILAMILVLPVAYGYDYYKEQQAIQEVETTQAEVQRKEHVPSRTTYVLSGKVMVPIRIAEQYNIHLKAGEHQDIIDNQQIYESLEVGDKLEVRVVTYIDESGETLTQKIQLMEEEE